MDPPGPLRVPAACALKGARRARSAIRCAARCSSACTSRPRCALSSGPRRTRYTVRPACSRSVMRAVWPMQRQSRALLLGVFAARVGTGLHEIDERVGTGCAGAEPRAVPVRCRRRRAAASGQDGGRAAAAAPPAAPRPAPAPGGKRRACHGARSRWRRHPGCGWVPSGALGSQLRLRSISALSCSAVRCGTLLTKGTGALVMYSATPSASASPISSPTTRPSTKPPRWLPRSLHAAASCATGASRAIDSGAPHAQHRQRVAQHLRGGGQQRHAGPRQCRVVDQEAFAGVVAVERPPPDRAGRRPRRAAPVRPRRASACRGTRPA